MGIKHVASIWLSCAALAWVTAAGDVVVDMRAAKNFSHYWKGCVGSGHMLLATRADYQAHLRRAREELGFMRIRGHGILDDDMSVVPERGSYEFFNIDTVYDFLLSIGVRPIVELSFMPKALVNCTGDDCQYAFTDPGSYKGLVMPPTNYTDWYDLIQALGQHLVDRYGIDEVSQWHFEVWNEMWGVNFPQPYMHLYATAAAALKGVNKRLRVGGPATEQTLNVGDFVRAAQENDIPFDFVSTHLYPTDPECGQRNLTCFERMILAARREVNTLSKRSVEFIVSEYNAGLWLQEDTDLDSPTAAAFIFRQVAALEEVDILSWWTFTDIFEEGWMRSTPFQNGYGLMTVNGVPKPSWRAFELLAQAGAKRLEVLGAAHPHDMNSTLTVLATLGLSATGSPELSLFVAEWLPPPSGTEPMTKNVSIRISHCEETDLEAPISTVARIDQSHANPKALWKAWGQPKYLNTTQVAALSAASALQEEVIQVRRISTTASVVALTLSPNSAARIRIPVANLASLALHM